MPLKMLDNAFYHVWTVFREVLSSLSAPLLPLSDGAIWTKKLLWLPRLRLCADLAYHLLINFDSKTRTGRRRNMATADSKDRLILQVSIQINVSSFGVVVPVRAI